MWCPAPTATSRRTRSSGGAASGWPGTSARPRCCSSTTSPGAPRASSCAASCGRAEPRLTQWVGSRRRRARAVHGQAVGCHRAQTFVRLRRLCERTHEKTTLALMPQRSRRRIPEATVARLPVYLRSLLELADSRITTVSSERLAEMAGVNAAKVRKDLSYLGSYGTRGVGYDVEYLLHEISRELGLTHDWPVAIVGVGNLGQALANYHGFGARGYRIVAVVDADPQKVGRRIGDLPVE